MVRRILFAISVLAIAASPRAIAQTVDVAAIDNVFVQFTRPNTPGCVLGVGRDGTVLYKRGYGMANLEYDVPLTDSTIVEIGSVSKQFTAAAILLLHQRGVLSLEDDIRKWLPEVPDFGHKITIRMLANHTSGLRDQWGLLGLLNSPPGSAVHTPELVLDLVTRQKELNFEPGDQYLYSNTGYTLLGIIVKRASGESLAEYSRKNIFEPLGMKHTQWRDDFTRVVKGRATAYSRGSEDVYNQDMPFTNVYGNGGLLTTVRDVIVWWDALNKGKLGNANFLTELTTSGVLNSGRKISYALGVSNGNYRGLREITHSGATAGYRAYVANYPDSKTTVAVLCNNASANATQLTQRVVDVVMASQLATTPARVAVTPAPGIDLSEYAGLYYDANTHETHRIEVRDGILVASGIELVPTGPGTFVDARRSINVTASRNGNTITLTLPMTESPDVVLTRMAEFKPDAAALQEYAGEYTSPELGITYRAVVHNGTLWLKRRTQTDLALHPTYKDGFSNFGNWVFTRNQAGKVNGLTYSQGRLRAIRFARAN